MASQVLTNVKTYLGEYDITGFTNAVMLDYAAAALDDTRMGQTTQVNKGGVKTVTFQIGGFADPASAGMDAIAFGKIGTSNIPLTCVPVGGGAVDDVADFFHALKANMETFGQHGELMPFRGNAVGGGASIDKLVRGQVFVSSAVAKTATSTSGIVELGAVSASQRVYAALHVIDTVSGTTPTLDVTVESAALVGFGSPTTRLTFTQTAVKTSELLSAAGAITDEFWRVDFTIGGTDTPTFPFIVVVGIL
jgi:hypothetical protein